MKFTLPYPLQRLVCTLTALALALMLTACGTPDRVSYVSPRDRPKPLSNLPWPSNHYLALAYHDVEDDDPDQSFVGVSTDNLLRQLAWLRQQGYTPVNIDQILAAGRGGPALPDKAVLLSFDDGYRSFYEKVYPLLKAYNWPAVLAPVGRWIDTPADTPVDFGGRAIARDRFLTWPQITEMAASGLIEIGAHSNDLHYGMLANPQGNTEPAAAARRYDPVTRQYENDDQYARRIRQDVAQITEKITQASGRVPRVWVWPYGAASGIAAQAVQAAGYSLLLTLEDGLAVAGRNDSVPRLLVANNPGLGAFSAAVISTENVRTTRSLRIRMDQLYDPDPALAEQRLGQLIQRIADFQITSLYIDPLSDTNGDGQIDAAYFPNTVLPMRADLFNRVAWQLRSRAFVKVYASMPVTTRGLAQWNDEARDALFTDLARSAIFAGVELEDSGGTAIATNLIKRMKDLRGPEFRHVARMSLSDPGWAENLVQLAARHDMAILSVPLESANPAMLGQIAGQVNRLPQGTRHALVELDISNPRKVASTQLEPSAPDEPARSAALAERLKQLQRLGLANLGYASDDFLNDEPRQQIVRPALSTAWYPLK